MKELQGIRNEELATQIPIPTPTYEPGLEPELVPIEVLTKDWKTYNDSKNNISFKYPPTWAYELGETGITNGYAGFDTKILNNEKNINYFFSVNLETLPDFNNWSKYVSTKKINSQTINNKTFDKYILADMYYSLNYIYKQDGKMIRFMLYPYTEIEQTTVLDKTIDQILSTFKFTD